MNENKPAGNSQGTSSEEAAQVKGSVPFSPHADLPPLPPVFSVTNKENPDVKDRNQHRENSSKPQSEKLKTILSSPKKKYGKGKVVAVIFGILLLVGGIAAGIILVSQQQLFQQKADACDDAKECNPGETACGSHDDPDNNLLYKCYAWSDACPNSGYWRSEGTSCATPPPVGSGECSNTGVDDGCRGRSPGDTYCSPYPGEVTPLLRTCYFLYPGTDNRQCGNTIGGPCGSGNCAINIHTGEWPAGCTPEPTTHPTNPPTIPPTTPPTIPPTTPPTIPPTSTPIPLCEQITTYDSEWDLITKSALSLLNTGDTVNFCVNGTVQSGSFIGARFTVNGVLGAETSNLRPGSTDFCMSYEIPEGVATFNVTGEVHHSSGGWY